MRLFVYICFVFLASDAWAWNIQLRAREHFEIYKPTHDGRIAKYQGLSNTINLWHEVPFSYAIGLAFGPVLGSAKTHDHKDSAYGESIKLYSLGAEWKAFLLPPEYGAFYRTGVFANFLDTEGPAGNLKGGSVYLGVGWEFKVRSAGIAAELAMRQTFLEKGAGLFSFTPSIGVHFYR